MSEFELTKSLIVDSNYESKEKDNVTASNLIEEYDTRMKQITNINSPDYSINFNKNYYNEKTSAKKVSFNDKNEV